MGDEQSQSEREDRSSRSDRPVDCGGESAAPKDSDQICQTLRVQTWDQSESMVAEYKKIERF